MLHWHVLQVDFSFSAYSTVFVTLLNSERERENGKLIAMFSVDVLSIFITF